MEIELQRRIAAIIRARENINEVIQILEEYPTEINLNGGTPLNHAIKNDRNEIVKYLIERGANVNALEDGHYSPLISAVESNNIEMVKLFLEKGADVNHKDKHGNDALWKAIFNYNLEIVKLLVERGANPYDASNRENYSNYDLAKDLLPVSENIFTYLDDLKRTKTSN